MAGGYLNGTVTFSTNPQRTRAQNAIQQWIANWNAANPQHVFSGSTTQVQYTYPADFDDPPSLAGTSQRALSLAYTCTSYDGIEAAQRAIAQDVNANAVLHIISLGTGPIF